jgi:hypothetical protein
MRFSFIGAAASILLACGGSTSVTTTQDGGTVDAGGGDAGHGSGVALDHRASANACDHDRPTTEPVIYSDAGAPFVACTKNADCTAGENGRCVGNGHSGYQCSYDTCFSDADCGAAVCACATSDGANHCLTANCHVDTDCPSIGGNVTGFCSPSLGSCGNYSGTVGYFCHTADDECTNDADCGGASAYCQYERTIGHWRCSTTQCAG